MTAPQTDTQVPADPPPGVLYSSYCIGMFSLALSDLYAVIVPLYALSLSFSATEVGVLTAARGILPTILSIHGGSLMDRLGTRRVTLGCSLATTVFAVMIPALPWFWPLFAIQLFSGLFMTFNWIGAQTLMAQICNGDAVILGRFNFIVRIGTIAAPVIAGLIWDFGGPWPTFLMIALWGAILYWLVYRIAEPNEEFAKGPRPSILEALPRVSDYTRTFALMLMPIIAFTIVIGALRNATTGVQTSIYIVYLQEIGFQGTLIGLLFAGLEISIAVASLGVKWVRRLGPPEWVLLGSAVVAILAITVTPYLGGFFILLLLFQVFRGFAQGFMQPMMFSIQSIAVGKDRQGAVVGLRLAANRIITLIVPPVMGVIADWTSLETSFIVVGAILVVGCVWTGILLIRRPEFRMRE